MLRLYTRLALVLLTLLVVTAGSSSMKPEDYAGTEPLVIPSFARVR